MSQSATQNDPSSELPSGPVPTVLEAIVKQRCVLASYNRGSVTLAPHILYTRNGALYIDAVTLIRDGQPPREEKMGSFKLDGLGDLRPSIQSFAISRLFHANDPKYDQKLMMVAPETANS